MTTPLTPLTGSDTFQTLFNTTNNLITVVSGISGGVASTGGGITGAYVASFNGLTGVITFSNYVSSFNGLTGAVAGVTGIRSGNSGITITGTTNPVIVNAGVLSVNGSSGVVENIARLDTTQIFTTLQQYTAGISASGATFNGNVVITGNLIAPGFNPNSVSGVASFNGLTGAVTGVTTSIANVFTPVQTFNAGISAAGATLNGNLTVNATSVFNGNVTITGSLTATIPTVTNVVSSLNGLTGNLTGVASFNGLTGAVTGVTTSVANVFTPVQTFNAGISAAGATFTGDVRISTITVGRGKNPNNSTAVGVSVLSNNTDGNDNTGVGYNALSNNSTGDYNTGIGSNALAANTNGVDNTAIGFSSLLISTNGNDNTAVGYNTLSGNASGNYNTGLGSTVLINSTGTGNLGAGYRSLTGLASGDYNTAVGTDAGKNSTGTSKSVLLGYNTQVNNAASSNNEIVIGADAVGLGSNTAVIGSTLINQTKINGIVLVEKGLSLTSCGISLSAPYNTTLSLYQVRGNTFELSNVFGITTYPIVQIFNESTSNYSGNTLDYSSYKLGVFGRKTTVYTTSYPVLNYQIIYQCNLGFGQGIFGPTLSNASSSIRNIVIGNNIASKSYITDCVIVGHDSVYGSTVGTQINGCDYFGNRVGKNSISSGGNVGIGSESFGSAYYSNNNTSLGKNNFAGISFCQYNVSAGLSNLINCTSVNYSVAIGNSILSNIANSSDNIGIGRNILRNLNGGNGNNIGVGTNTLEEMTTGQYNVAIGSEAMYWVLDGSENTALGYRAAYEAGDESVVEGCTSSIFIGPYTKPAISGGFNEIVIGYDAVGKGSNTTVIGNTYTTSTTLRGVLSVPSGITGVAFTKDITVNGARVGIGAGNLTTNAAVGVGALNANTTGTHNVAVGSGSLLGNTDGADNTAVGFNALTANTSGIENSAFGSGALSGNVGGVDNTAIGYNALTANISGSSNVAIGAYTLQSNTTGNNNTGIGISTLSSVTKATYNIGVGAQVLSSLTAGTGNIGIGTSALTNLELFSFQSPATNLKSNYNTAIGYNAGKLWGTGSDSTFGYLTSATGGVFIGYNTRASANDQKNETVIGANAIGLGSNTAVIGTTATVATRFYGVASIGQVAPTIASTSTISPTTSIVFVSGTAAISTITPPTLISTTGGQVTLIPTGIFTTTTSGNIALASTAVVSKAMIMTYDAGTGKWYPSY
jgi:hypothetical protein